MRPMKYDGVGSFETFLAHFRNCADHNKWNKTEQLTWLKGCLINNAGQVLWDSSADSTDTLPKLIDVLTNRFGGTKQTNIVWNCDIEGVVQMKLFQTYIKTVVD